MSVWFLQDENYGNQVVKFGIEKNSYSRNRNVKKQNGWIWQVYLGPYSYLRG